MSAVSKVTGIHAAEAAIKYSPERVKQIWIDSDRKDKRIQRVLEELQLHVSIEPQYLERKKLDRLVGGYKHQGIVLEVEMPSEKGEAELKDWIQSADETPLFLILDQVQDPHNLGACLRTCDAAGVHGIIVTKDNASGLTPTVCQVASGAAETIPVYKVTNLARMMKWMKEQGIWIVGTAGEAETTVYQQSLTGPLAVVVGAEGSGMRRLTRDNCDSLIKIPMTGTVESLNLSVATGVILFEAVRQRAYV